MKYYGENNAVYTGYDDEKSFANALCRMFGRDHILEAYFKYLDNTSIEDPIEYYYGQALKQKNITGSKFDKFREIVMKSEVLTLIKWTTRKTKPTETQIKEYNDIKSDIKKDFEEFNGR